MKRTIDVSVRRSPKYSVFIGIGVVIGMIAGFVLWSLPVDTSELTRQFSEASILWTLMVFLGIVCGFLGAMLALLLDRVSVRRARTYAVDAEYTRVRQAEEQPEAADPEDRPGASGTRTDEGE